MATCPACGKEPIAEKKAEVLAEHFQKTFEFNHSRWEERNKNFLVLLGITGVELLLIYRTDGVLRVMADFYSNFLKDKGPDDIASGFPFNLLISILLIVILYLMIQIYHRTSHINSTYGYLEKVEGELRNTLEITIGHSLTREGAYYKNNQRYLLKLTGVVYALILGALLLFIAYGKIRPLRRATTISIDTLLPTVDVLVLAIIAVYYFNYLYLLLEPYIAGDIVKHVREWIRARRDVLSSGEFLKMLFSAVILYGLPYSLITVVMIYLFEYGIEWANLSWWKGVKALLLIVLISIVFGIFSSLWLLRTQQRVAQQDGV
jgi:uncharacterized membrane-anchored protein YitT (DUF2179 family)